MFDRKKIFRWKTLRQITQLGFLLAFFYLFRHTDYNGTDEITAAVNVLFRLDPLVGASVILATKSIVSLVWPALIVVGITFVFGRFFCGWFCPLGTLLDIYSRIFKSPNNVTFRLRYVKYFLLVVILVSALFNLQLVGYFDPFSILVRGMTFAIDPISNVITTGFFDGIYKSTPEAISNITEPVYSLLKKGVLPYKQSFYFLSITSFLILIAIFFIERYGKRFWCRSICPLGGMLALFSRFSFFRRMPAMSCNHCRQCSTDCKMDAFTEKGQIMQEECNLCMDCLDYCPDGIAKFKLKKPKNKAELDLGRRKFVAAAVVGGVLPAMTSTSAVLKKPNPFLLRPPGAKEENEFMALCVRCGECMKVCIQNALQPMGFESGLEGFFTPKLIPRLGYCEFNCTLCGQVCPTGAIEKLTLKEKQAFVIGVAYFDKNRCIPYATDKPCIVCEEHCPTHDKAIKFNEVEKVNLKGDTVVLKQPYVIEELCIGCGICEKVCPLTGNAAVLVVRKDIKEDEFGGYY